MAAIMLVGVEAGAQGWKKFKKVLQKEFDGHRPFNLPDVHYAPGTVMLVYNRNEQIYSTAASSFPSLTMKPPSPLPGHKIVKIKEITFSAAAESNLIPGYLSAVARMGLDVGAGFNLEIKHAEKHQIEIADLELLLLSLNYGDPRDRLLLDKLTGDARCIIITQALLFEGVTFTFHRKTRFDYDTRAQLLDAARDACVKLTILNDYQFTLTADAPLYYAYDFYRKSPELMKVIQNPERQRSMQPTERQDVRPVKPESRVVHIRPD
jgi:hypothetical protein